MSWEWAMRLALDEADGCDQTSDVPVGAIVVRTDAGSSDGQLGAVLSRGRNEREFSGDPTAHAEILAVRRAGLALGGWRLNGYTLVVTLEPCTMCAGAAVAARLDQVVFGAVDPKAGAAGSLWDVVRDRRLHHRPAVQGGVLAAECGLRLAEFFTPDASGSFDHGGVA